MAEDAIVAQYIVKTDAAIAQLNALSAKVAGIETAGKKSAKGTEDAFEKMGQSLNNQFKQVGSMIAGAFAVDRLLQFGKEAVQVAARAEGIERAFARVGSPQLLEGLRKATRGTVDDITLMTTAIQAANFKVPLEQLAKYMQFAHQRANETGKSVDYMIESILTGVGRGSIEVWDNMGFALSEVRAKLNGVSIESLTVADRAKLMGDLVDAELQKMGDQSDTTADKIGRLDVAYQNLIKSSGEALIKMGAVTFLENLNKAMIYFSGNADEFIQNQIDSARATNNANAALERYKNLVSGTTDSEKQRQLALKELEFQMSVFLKGQEKIAIREQELSDLRETIANRQQRLSAEAAGFTRASLVKEVEELKKKEKAILDGIEAQNRVNTQVGAYVNLLKDKAGIEKNETEQTQEQIRNIFFLTNAIKALNEEKEREGTTRERILQINEELKPLEEDLAFLQGKLADKTKDSNKALEEYLATIEKFNRGIEIWQNKQLEIIDAQSDIDRLYTMRTVFDAEERADALTEIEKARLRKRIELMKSFGRDTIAEQIKLEQIEIDGREELMKEMAALEKRFRDGMDEDYNNSLEYRKKKLEDFAAFEAEMRAEQMELFNGVSGFIMQTIGQVSQYEQQEAQRRYAVVDELLEKQLISEEDAAERKKRIARDEAKKNKELAIFAAIIGTAQSVVNAMATAPNYIVGAIFAALAGIAGGIQIATIENEPLPSFGEGGFVEDGWIKGRSHGQGGVKLEAEGGEFIVNKKSAHKYSDLLEAINEDRPTLAPPKGWENLAQSIAIQQAFNDQNLLRAIDRHREGEVGLLRDLLTEVKKSNGRPLRGGYHA